MKTPATVDPAPPGDLHPTHVWYTSYGSNTDLARLACYLRGGRPAGAVREQPGCRDPGMPARSLPAELPGALYFATESQVWGGGRAFYDPRASGRVLARAHLVSAAQFSDIAAQEMYRAPGEPLDLAEVLTRGRATLGQGRYETLVHAGRVDGLPLLTFTAPWRMDDVEHTPPSPAYLRCLVSGLLSADAWSPETITAYVAACPGAYGHWPADAVAGVVRDCRAGGPARTRHAG
ncbi:histone deacetylase [Streptomyces minutiscleroticus]|uniref:histone deacetylase n=1 Tax=Streptomyces minutiscleroticus TaxID=68238 RepID=UPI00167D9CC9|nr:histone deacetylase [Streptomyces minutiscleroticus]